jgi:hypothetical protein
MSLASAILARRMRLGIAAVALNEGRDAWRGEACCTAPIAGTDGDGGAGADGDGCTDGCC